MRFTRTCTLFGAIISFILAMIAYLRINIVICFLAMVESPHWAASNALSGSKQLPRQDLKSTRTSLNLGDPRANLAAFNKSELDLQPNKAVAGLKQSMPILIYKEPSREEFDRQQAPRNLTALVRNKSVEREVRGPKDKDWSISPVGYFTIIVVGSLVLLIFLLVFMYMQQHQEVPRGVEESNSHLSEAKQLLKNRLYVVKRYIPYHFDAGLPCPEKNTSLTSSSLSVSPKNAGTTTKQTLSSPHQAIQKLKGVK